MVVTNDLADWLAIHGEGVKGASIFQGEMPEAPDDSILLREGGGAGPTRSMDNRRLQRIGITIIVRGARDQLVQTNEKTRRVYDLMLDLMHTAINGTRYVGTQPLGDIADLGRDELDRWKFSMNFLVLR